MKFQTLLLAAAVSLLPVVAGCESDQRADKARAMSAKPIENPNFLRLEFNMPPKDLIELSKRVLSSPPYNLTVQDEGKGVLVTDWKEYQGAFHIVRYWQERTRYQVTVSPDFDNPTGKCSLRVAQETQTRASSKGNWFALLDEDRSNRASELAHAIQQAAQK